MKRIISNKKIIFLFLLSFGVCITSLFSIQTFAKEKSVSIKIPVQCEYNDQNQSFNYKLSYEEGTKQTSQEIKNEQLSLVNKETQNFEIKFLEPGKYQYKIVEESESNENIVYDKTIYTIDVYVTENDNGILNAEPIVYIKGNNSKENICLFKNTTIPKESVIEPTTKKEVSVQTGDKFNFERIIAIISLSAASVVLFVRKKEVVDNEE